MNVFSLADKKVIYRLWTRKDETMADITISLDEYKALLKMESRVEILMDRYVSNSYISKEDISEVFNLADPVVENVSAD